jgi:radical SAM-linked protein
MRIRFRFAKLGKIRFTSQRDVARMWERALRRAELPLAYTEGFSPRPQLSFGLALPTGCESLAEYVDVALDATRAAGIEAASLPALLTPLLPEGIDVEEAVPVEKGPGSLQQLVTSCSWTMRFTGVSKEELRHQVESLLSAPSVPIVRERKGRQVHDDRPIGGGGGRAGHPTPWGPPHRVGAWVDRSLGGPSVSAVGRAGRRR